MPHYPKETNLINYINRAEIVKNFTNFACGFGGEAIKFWRHQTGRFRFTFARVFDGSPFFARKKTIDGERFLKRIQVLIGVRGWFVVGN